MDDEDTFRESTRVLVEQAGYTCDAAANTAAAEDMIRDTEYALVISDIRMPTNDNLEFVRRLAQEANGIPVILVTGYPTLETAVAAIDLSVGGYLVKPFEIEDLLNQIHRCLLARRNFEDSLDHTKLVLNNCRNVLESVEEMVVRAERAKPGTKRTQALPSASTNKTSMVAALEETIAVLEKTTSSFRSKELARLRRRLEKIVKGEPAAELD